MKKLLFSLSAITLAILMGGCARDSAYYKWDPSTNYPTYSNDIPGSEKYKDYDENPFIKVSESPVSTFSIDADGASYANMRRFLNLGQKPPKASVRIEEYLNYFTFDYPQPEAGENAGINYELSSCPWNESNNLLRVGIKGREIPQSELPNSNYVFLIDVSGSMSSPEKLNVLKSGFTKMADNLRDNDRVSIVTYSGRERILLRGARGKDKTQIKGAISELSAGGATAGARALVTAYEIAQEYFIKNGNNRIILGTDGDFNVGVSSTEELVKFVSQKREEGVYLTVLGVGSGNLNDHMMEQIANKGNGNYEYIDNAKQIEKVFVHERSKFHTVAKDSKIQLTFNPSMVDSYRLIGYENRALDEEDFDDDEVDAGEIGSGQTITALYELVLIDAAQVDKYATFDFRYKLPGSDSSRPLTLEIKNPPVKIEKASENMRFAAAVAGFGMLAKESQYKGSITTDQIIKLAENAKTFDPNGYRSEFIELVGHFD